MLSDIDTIFFTFDIDITKDEIRCMYLQISQRLLGVMSYRRHVIPQALDSIFQIQCDQHFVFDDHYIDIGHSSSTNISTMYGSLYQQTLYLGIGCQLI